MGVGRRCMWSIALALFALSCAAPIRAGTWVDVVPDAYTPTEITQASISGDGTKLYLFYREPDPNLNIDKGLVKYLNLSRWASLASVTNECHDPDIAYKGGQVSAVWYDDGHKGHMFYSDAGGSYWTAWFSLMRNQYGLTAAIAKGVPYACFASMESSGSPSSYMMLHIHNQADKPGLDGGWGGEPLVSIDSYPSMTGDSLYWYSVCTQNGNLFVKRDGSDYGAAILGQGTPEHPEIVMYKGSPVVAWLASSRVMMHVVGRSLGSWVGLGSFITDGAFREMRLAATSDDLYLSVISSDDDPALYIVKWNGSTWDQLPCPTTASSTAITTLDITIYDGSPCVAYVENGTLRTKVYRETSAPTNLAPVIMLLLGAG